MVISQPGTILDYLSEISYYPPSNGWPNNVSPLTSQLSPLASDYPFSTITGIYAPLGAGFSCTQQTPMTQQQFETALKQALSSSNQTVGSLIASMHQMVATKDPTEFADEVYSILTNQTLDLGQTWYIYADPNPQDVDAAGVPKLIISQTAPSYANINQKPNGTPQVYTSHLFKSMGMTLIHSRRPALAISFLQNRMV